MTRSCKCVCVCVVCVSGVGNKMKWELSFTDDGMPMLKIVPPTKSVS